MDSLKNAAQSKLGKDSQPGNNVERQADNAVDQRTKPLLDCWSTVAPLPSCHTSILIAYINRGR